MNANAMELIQQVQALGVELKTDGHRILARPKHALPPELRRALLAHKEDVIAALYADEPVDIEVSEVEEALAATRQLHELYASACLELAQHLGFPSVQYKQGHSTLQGEVLWRKFLDRAPLAELRNHVLPALRTLVNAITPPEP
jgi:hypothetical protein